MNSAPYIVCSTPRSGSTLLCDLLTSTGVAGQPREHFRRLYSTGLPRQPREHFENSADDTLLAQLPPDVLGTPEDADAFEQRLQDARAAGATHLRWGYTLDLFRRLHERPETSRLRPHDALAELFPGVRYVHVRRQDKLGQAIALWTALQSGEPVFHFGAIAHLRDQLTLQERAWARYFQAAGVRPEIVTYEDLIADRRAATIGLLQGLGISPTGKSVEDAPTPLPSKRARAWAERFEAERRGVAA